MLHVFYVKLQYIESKEDLFFHILLGIIQWLDCQEIQLTRLFVGKEWRLLHLISSDTEVHVHIFPKNM